MNTTILLQQYRDGDRTPEQTVEEVYERLDTDATNAWISVRDKADVLSDARALDSQAEQPLYGVPFAVKDNIDYSGLPTTAGCPAYAYTPDENATVVDRLIEAGALLIGKTNMDQFATGLVGTRSPYGVCRNVYNGEYISGGSSSGSAVVVARGEVAFALGTDTAGSGRVPAACNGLVGLKPSRGMLSTHGVVPACASLDCVAIFGTSCEETLTVESVLAGYDDRDPYSRRRAEATDFGLDSHSPSEYTVGVPAEPYLEFFGDAEAKRLFESVRSTLDAHFAECIPIDFEPFIETGKLLYDGPWVAERLLSIQEFVRTQSDAMHPVVSEILTEGAEYSALDTFRAFHALEERRQECSAVFENVDAIVTPTIGTMYRIEEVLEQPIELNSNLGYYTDYVNLLDLAAVAVPTGTFDEGPGFGVTVLGEATDDGLVAAVGDRIQATIGGQDPPWRHQSGTPNGAEGRTE